MNLKRIRLAKGLTQEQLAEKIGVDTSTVNRAEKMASTARLETYRFCAEALGVTLADIFADELTPVERALLESFRRIPEDRRHHLIAMFEIAEATRPEKA